MPDITIKNETVNNYYIEIVLKNRHNNNFYHIMMIDEFGHVDRDNIKADKESALKTYGYYKRVAKNL